MSLKVNRDAECTIGYALNPPRCAAHGKRLGLGLLRVWVEPKQYKQMFTHLDCCVDLEI